MLVLAIDTSNTVLSIALVEDKNTLLEITEITKNDHSKRLMPAIDQLFKETGCTPQQLDYIAVAEGPGSYTGVRIGVTVAKTLAWTLNKPLVSMSSLELVARNIDEDGLVIPLFDARRETVFAGVYDAKTKDVVIEDGHYELRQLLKLLNESSKKMYFLGNDVPRYWEIIVEILGKKAICVDDNDLNIPHAANLGKQVLDLEPVENIHTFVPKYHRLPEAEMNWLQDQKKQG